MTDHATDAAAASLHPGRYWEARARRFARHRGGLAAVCSYGLPSFHNRYIDLLQRLALRPWLADVTSTTSVLDVGCGIGRWSRRLARRGATVTGVDLASVMVHEARRRAAAENLAHRCGFRVADLTDLDLPERYSRILCVTVLQHIVQPDRFLAAVQRLAGHLTPDGRALVLEAAPSSATSRFNGAAFVARDEATYRAAFATAGLQCVAVTGVDPAPFRLPLQGRYARLPRSIALTGLAAATVLSLPVDLVAGRRLSGSSWHKLFVLDSPAEG